MSEKQLSCIYDALVTQKAPNTDDLTIEGPAVRAGEIVILDCFYIYDHTTAGKKVRLGIDRKGTICWFKQEPTATDVHGMAQNGKMILVDGEKPIGMIESPTTADVCYLVARGVYL